MVILMTSQIFRGELVLIHHILSHATQEINEKVGHEQH